MRKKEDELNIWPSFTDLFSGVVLMLFIILMPLLSSKQSLLESLIRLQKKHQELEEAYDILKKMNIAHHREKRRLKKELRLSREQNRIIGVSRKFLLELKKQLKQFNPSINEYGNLEISADLLFGHNERNFGDASKVTNQMEAKKIQNRKERATLLGKGLLKLLESRFNKNVAAVVVIGHTDKAGKWEYNLDLSLDRSASLVKLWKRSFPEYFRDVKIAKSRGQKACIGAKLLVSGFGKTRLKVSPETFRKCGNSSKYSRGCRANRRIEIRILPKGDAPEVPGCL